MLNKPINFIITLKPKPKLSYVYHIQRKNILKIFSDLKLKYYTAQMSTNFTQLVLMNKKHKFYPKRYSY